jgi:hypothetical protein
MAQQPTRADQEKVTRRRQRGSTVLPGLKLSVNEKLLDRENFTYRWINDNGGRIEQLTRDDDYDLVRDPSKEVKDDNGNEGALISKVVGTTENNQPIRAYLARKPKPFYDADQKEKAKVLDAQMADIKRGKPSEAAQMAGNDYVPQGGISIDEGRRT